MENYLQFSDKREVRTNRRFASDMSDRLIKNNCLFEEKIYLAIKLIIYNVCIQYASSILSVAFLKCIFTKEK